MVWEIRRLDQVERVYVAQLMSVRSGVRRYGRVMEDGGGGGGKEEAEGITRIRKGFRFSTRVLSVGQ